MGFWNSADMDTDTGMGMDMDMYIDTGMDMLKGGVYMR